MTLHDTGNSRPGRYRVDLYLADEDDIKRYLGTWVGEAESEGDARTKAVVALRAERLDATTHAVITTIDDVDHSMREKRTMPHKTIKPDDLVILRWLDEQADTLRRAVGLHARGEIVTWYEQPGGKREYTVTADGYGRFELVAYEGRNPNDRLFCHSADYDDEEAAWRAAMRLGEHRVSWEDRDTPVPNEDEDDQPPETWKHNEVT